MSCLNPALNPMFRGDVKTMRFTITDSTGAPVNITGDSVILTVKLLKSDTVALLDKTVTTHTDAVNGITTVTIDPDESYTFPIRTVLVGVTWLDGTNPITLLDTTMQVLEPVLTPTAP